MEFATIPETSIRISRVGLGTWAIGGWMWGGTDQGASVALWGARHPGLQPIGELFGWSLDAAAKTEIDRILRGSITAPVGPEFMAPPARSAAGITAAAQ
jgi:hypothetical protein